MPSFAQQSESTVKLSQSDKSANGSGDAPRSAGDIRVVEMEDLRNGDSYVNGERPLVNGHHLRDAPPTTSKSSHQKPTAVERVSRQLPPEIQHVSSGYVSLSALIERLAQETFNDLGNVINDMAEIPVERPRSNGVLNHVNHQVNGHVPGKSEANVQKKLRLLNFTNNWRPKFIKILVLSQWARQAEAVSRLIDLKYWEDMQMTEYNEAVTSMGELKRQLVAINEPLPDIKTALEVLLLGKASWLPHFGYLKAEQLSTRQLLEALRRINTLLSIRLNLHETIPQAFRDFSVASGRVTFRIPDEFEVDLSIADEDPTSQLYFVDFRFDFSPSVSGLAPGILRSDLEARANEKLSQEGLQGLYDFLHNLVLTHKLSILRSQAFDMARGYWSEHLVVEPVRRSVIVQYWSKRPGGKNWIEIGIKRGTQKRAAFTQTLHRIPIIGIRCFCGGKEVHDIKVDLRLGDLSTEYILKQVVARHSSYIFESIATKLLDGLLYSSGYLKVKYNASEIEPTDASLLVQLTATTAIKIIQEPISGRFAIQPSSQLNGRAEHELNRLVSPITEGPPQLSYLRSLMSAEEVETNARGIGWEAAKSISLGKEATQQHFPNTTLQTRFFRRLEWDSRWILAFTTSLEGDSWWLVELINEKPACKEPSLQVPPERLVKAVYGVFSKEKQSLVFASSRQTLTKVEWTAAGMISQHSDAREVAGELRHSILTSNTGVPTFTMLVQVPRTLLSGAERNSQFQSSRKTRDIAEAHETIGLLYRGFNATTRVAVRVATIRVKRPISNLKGIISKIPNMAVARVPVNDAPIGDASIEIELLKFKLVHKVGESCIPDLIKRLTAIERLLNYVSILESNKVIINSASLSHVDFTYASHPRPLKSVIEFPADAPVRLSFPSRSPHVRVRDYLTSWLSREGLVSVLGLLKVTLPILNAFIAVEKLHNSNGINIIARSEQWYEFRYSPPILRGGFDISLRLRRDEPYWFIKESSIRKTEPLDGDEEAWTQSLRTVARGKGKGWRGMRGGIVAHKTDGIGEALQKLDEVFRNAKKHTPENSRPKKRKAENQAVEID